jgi:XTP/dITP diphosphohydrolase
MNKRLVAATHNPDKLLELTRILSPRGIEVLPFEDKALLASIVEDGDTFAENALIKARAVFAATGLPTLADDSGLCVDALGGAPGVYSARYMGEDTSYDIKDHAIIAELNAIGETERTARFVCAAALVTKDGEHVFTGVCEGRIGYEMRGKNGFGYDPIFVVGDRTTAEMTNEEKDAISHRGRALTALANEIDHLL